VTLDEYVLARGAALIRFARLLTGYSRAAELALLASVRTVPTVHDPSTYP
jgi:hypothetical protein